jgi:hypothetical protein
VTDLHDLMKPYEVNLPATLVRHETQPERKPERLEPYTGPGVRLPALDAWFEPDPPPGTSSVRNLDVKTFPAEGNTPAKTFRPGDTFRLSVSADEIMNYQYVWINSARKVDTPSGVRKYQGLGLTPDFHVLPVTEKGKEKNVLGAVKSAETEQIRVFASPRQLEMGVRWRARLDHRVVERWVHPFFQLKTMDDRATVDVRDAQVVRRTVTIEIVPKK